MNVGELKVQATIETAAVKQGADKFVNELNRMDNATLKQLKNMGQLAAGYFAVGPAIQQFTRESINSFIESESASKTLSNALKGNQKDIERLTQQATELQNKSIFSDEQIMNAQAMFGFMGKNADEIEHLIPLVMNLGAAQERTGNGQANLVQISKMLARSTGEELSGSIERLIGPLSDNEKAMLNNAQGMERINLLSDIMQKRFGDIAFQLDDTASQWKNLNNKVDEFKEGFGRGFVEALNAGIKGLQRIQGENTKTQVSFSDLGYAVSKALVGPIMNLIDMLNTLESKYGETLNSIQQKVVEFMQYLQGNSVLKYLIPGLDNINLDEFATQRSNSNDGPRGVTGDGKGDRGKMFNSSLEKNTKKDGKGNRTGTDKQEKEEELNFLQKYREDITKLEADEASLNQQLLETNLQWYERLAILAELESVQKKLAEMKFNTGIDITGKEGDLSSLMDMVKGLGDDPRFIRAGKPFTGAKQSGPAAEGVGISLEQWMNTAKNIREILNQPLDNPFQTMQMMLQIAMQIAMLTNGGQLSAGLSFLGPIGMGIGLLGGIFGGLFSGSKSGSGHGSKGSMMQRLGAMISNSMNTGIMADLPAPFYAFSGGGMNGGVSSSEFYFNGRKIDRKLKEEFNRDGVMMTEFNYRNKYK